MNDYRNMNRAYKHYQTGTLMPLIAIGMLAILGVAGLAIDSSHAFVNVTRVQNALDAAALSAAKSLHLHNKDTVIAQNHGAATFAEHLDGEMSDDVTVTFQFSTTLNPFVPGGVDPNFVRATSNNHTIGMFFAHILPGVGDDWTIGSTAVSGPIPLTGGEICDIVPLLVCGDPSDTDPTDGTIGGLPIGTGDLQCLKHGAGTNSGNNGGNGGNGGGGIETAPSECAVQQADDPDGVGPGNYHLLRLDGSNGGDIDTNLGGGYQGCASFTGNLDIDTEPGNMAGPVQRGINSRFGDYSKGNLSPSDYPPDLVTTSPMSHEDYSAIYKTGGPFNGDGEESRRIVMVPIADCSGIQNGQSQVPVFAFGCYFLTQKIENGGQNSYIVGELIDDCEASGTPGDGNPDLGGPYKIILFNDPGNPAT